MTSPFLYLPGRRLTLTELTAARLDGDVVEVGDAYIPADAVETADLRAGSLADLLGTGLAAVRLSAAWVHGALDDPPARHTVQRLTTSRTTWLSTARFVYHDVLLPERDVVRWSGCAVTTSARTLADLARSADPAHRDAARAFAQARDGVVADALSWLDRHRGMPNARAGRAFLRELEAETARSTPDAVDGADAPSRPQTAGVRRR